MKENCRKIICGDGIANKPKKRMKTYVKQQPRRHQKTINQSVLQLMEKKNSLYWPRKIAWVTKKNRSVITHTVICELDWLNQERVMKTKVLKTDYLKWRRRKERHAAYREISILCDQTYTYVVENINVVNKNIGYHEIYM